VRRLLGWLAGAAGGLAAYRAVTRRRAEPDAAANARADELRAKLAQAREAGDDRDAFEAGETPVDEAESLDPNARRARVHEQGRSAIDEMRGGK